MKIENELRLKTALLEKGTVGLVPGKVLDLGSTSVGSGCVVMGREDTLSVSADNDSLTGTFEDRILALALWAVMGHAKIDPFSPVTAVPCLCEDFCGRSFERRWKIFSGPLPPELPSSRGGSDLKKTLAQMFLF